MQQKEKNKIKIILAEDEPDLMELYSRAFSARGFDVFAAKNGKQVFEWLEKKGNSVDALVLDIVMPDMDGFEVLQKLKKEGRFSKLPIFVCSNLDNNDDRKEAFGYGVKEYFEKTKFTPQQIAEGVEKILKVQK